MPEERLTDWLTRRLEGGYRCFIGGPEAARANIEARRIEAASFEVLEPRRLYSGDIASAIRLLPPKLWICNGYVVAEGPVNSGCNQVHVTCPDG